MEQKKTNQPCNSLSGQGQKKSKSQERGRTGGSKSTSGTSSQSEH